MLFSLRFTKALPHLEKESKLHWRRTKQRMSNKIWSKAQRILIATMIFLSLTIGMNY